MAPKPRFVHVLRHRLTDVRMFVDCPFRDAKLSAMSAFVTPMNAMVNSIAISILLLASVYRHLVKFHAWSCAVCAFCKELFQNKCERFRRGQSGVMVVRCHISGGNRTCFLRKESVFCRNNLENVWLIFERCKLLNAWVHERRTSFPTDNYLFTLI